LDDQLSNHWTSAALKQLSMTALSLLSHLRTKLTIDVDSMDPAVAARHTGPAATDKFCDMTSNQAIVYSEASRPERAEIFKQAIATARDHGGSEHEVVDHALDSLVRFSI
jgi:transaldolase